MTHPFEVFGGKLSDSLLVADGFALDAKEISEKIISLRDEWTDRGHFWTLGTSAYIGGTHDGVMDILRKNEMLLENFKDVLLKAFQIIGVAAKSNVHPLIGAGLPGFHIVSNRANGKSGMFHVDIPYQNVKWPGPFVRPFTFTTLLAAPQVGAGLWYWDDMGIEEGAEIIEATRNDTGTAETPEEGRALLEYEIGKTYIHSGRFPHAIADMGEMEEDEYRITLQGHGAFLPEEDRIAVYF